MKRIVILFLFIFSCSFAKYEELYDVTISKKTEEGAVYVINSKEKYSKSEYLIRYVSDRNKAREIFETSIDVFSKNIEKEKINIIEHKILKFSALFIFSITDPVDSSFTHYLMIYQNGAELKMFSFTNPFEAEKLYKYLDVNKITVAGEKMCMSIMINQAKFKF